MVLTIEINALGGKEMLFDSSKLKGKEDKIAIGALKYIAIKEAFRQGKPLYENEIFRKYFTDFYVLRRGSFSTPMAQEVFYRLFQAVCELYDSKYNREDIFKNILTIISGIAGDNEASFSSKILHTLDNDSPIIDSNVLKGLKLKKTSDSYKDLLEKYYNALEIEVYDEPAGMKHIPSTNAEGLMQIACDDQWYEKFNQLCMAQYKSIFTAKTRKSKDNIKNIIKDICKVKYIKPSDSPIKKLEKEIEIEKTIDSASSWENLTVAVNGKSLEVDIEREIANIAKVKKIDFYLWARYAK